MNIGSSRLTVGSSNPPAPVISQSCAQSMTSLRENMMSAPDQPAPVSEQLDYLLRRAEQESIAAIRTVDERASDPHSQMACAYTVRALTLLGNRTSEG